MYEYMFINFYASNLYIYECVIFEEKNSLYQHDQYNHTKMFISQKQVVSMKLFFYLIDHFTIKHQNYRYCRNRNASRKQYQ